MRQSSTVLLFILVIFSLNVFPSNAPSATGDSDDSRELWYEEPAQRWKEALPVGNGRLGAMVFGRPKNERLQLNEDTLWAGQPYQAARKVQPETLDKIQSLIFKGKYQEASSLASDHLLGTPQREMAYQTLGNVSIKFSDHKHVKNYRRRLNLSTGIASVRYEQNDVTYRREVFASPVDDVIIMRIEADQPGAIHFHTSFNTPQKATFDTPNDSTLQMTGTNGSYKGLEGKLRFATGIYIRTSGGSRNAESNKLRVSGADAATIFIAADTSFNGPKDISGEPLAHVNEALKSSIEKEYETIRQAHVSEHRRLFDRVSFQLGTKTSDDQGKPTDQRLSTVEKSGDLDLYELFLQYARYLMISSSRPGSQPINLQGIWNPDMTPRWEGSYTLNTNLQMNYWIAEQANLAECHEPLIDLVEGLARTGHTTAKRMYNADGWVAHHNSDLWRRSSPADGMGQGQFQTGGAWLCQHLWWHYQYKNDQDYLKRIYPILKGASTFFLETLVDHPDFGWLVTCPSNSPENTHPQGTQLCAGPTIDMQILRDLFRWTIKASVQLDRDAGFRKRLRKFRKRLAPMQIGQHGQLQEWLYDWDDPADKHRHLSHLYGLFPGQLITPQRTPELANAARKSLQMRDRKGAANDWSAAWRSIWRARLGDSKRAYGRLRELLSGSTCPNMFTRWGKTFQIDGNFGGATAILQMLLQSHSGRILLLPALPSDWKNGSVKGLRARGGFEISMRWQDGQLSRATVHSRAGNKCTLSYDGKVGTFDTDPGETVSVNGKLQKITDTGDE